MSKRIKRAIIVILAVVILAVLWFGGRCIYLKQRYAPFYTGLDEGETSVRYHDQYTCGVAEPESLFSLRGNLYVTEIQLVSKNEDGEAAAYCDLLIYVEFPAGYTIYAQICDAYGNTYDNLKLTEQMELVSDDAADKQLYEEHYDAIYGAFSAAHEVFGIFELPD